MLVVIPSLTVNDPDVSLSLGAQMLHNLGYLNNADPATYQVSLLYSHCIMMRYLNCI